MNRNSLHTESEKDENIDFENMMQDDDGDNKEHGESKNPKSLKNVVEENDEQAVEHTAGSNTPIRGAASYFPEAKSNIRADGLVV